MEDPDPDRSDAAEGAGIFHRKKLWEIVKLQYASKQLEAFEELKALAFELRGENKDAYDLYFVIRNYGSAVDDVCRCLGPFLKEEETQRALEILNRNFLDLDGVGPSRVAQ